MATLFSHFWIFQFDEITGQPLHILNWPYTAAKWCGDFQDFVEWENQNGVQIAVQMFQIYKLPNEVVSVQCCHGDFLTTKIPKIEIDWLHFIWQLFLVNLQLSKCSSNVKWS
jgi:hypothetical protein